MKHRKGNSMFFPVFAFALVMVLVYFISQPILEGMVQKEEEEEEEEGKKSKKEGFNISLSKIHDVLKRDECLPDGRTMAGKRCTRQQLKDLRRRNRR
jgi:hypothetical protein